MWGSMLVIDPGALPQPHTSADEYCLPRNHAAIHIPPQGAAMKQKPPRWVQITAAVLRRYLALDMTVYAGSATLFLLTASFPLLM